MSISNSMASIDPVRLGPDSRFRFECHKGVECFTKCCRGINIILTPYDIIRLKNRLQLPSDEFLAIYTRVELLDKTDLPMVTLRLLDDEEESCPFVRDEGCIIYEDRPTACRYYPIGMASLAHQEGADDKDFFFFIHEPHCKGFEEKKLWRVNEWRQDQGVDVRDEINAGWTDLIVRKRSFPKNIKLTDKTKEMFFMASYNIDKFKKFLFESSFFDRYDIDSETIEKIKNDEAELLKFAMAWLKFILYKDGDFKTKPAA